MQNIRNIAIIAHVDHGKTTLVDKMLYTANVVSRQQSEFSDQPKELILDNNDLERERGITILAKNVAIEYKGTKINIIDTPGHADFGGEVERVLNMADGVLLLVDAFEGAMPQTRFVLQKALEIGLKPIVVINKVDKLNCRPDEVQEEVFDLMCNLNATDDQLDFQTLYGSAKQGWMSTDWKKPTTDLTDLMDAIIEYIPAPQENPGTPQMLITSLDYNPYVGRIAVGRLHRGELRDGQTVTLAKKDGTMQKTKIKELHTFSGMGHVKTDLVRNGDICALIGIDGFEIGDTICDAENPEPLKPIAIDEPTMSMTFSAKSGSELKLNVETRCGLRLASAQMRATRYRVTPACRLMSERDQRVASGGSPCMVMSRTRRTSSAEILPGRPVRGRSPSPSTPRSRKRSRAAYAVWTLHPRRLETA